MNGDDDVRYNVVIAHNVVIVAAVTAVNDDAAPDEIGRRLIDEAGRVLAREGVSGLSLRKVAQAAGTSTMSVYTRFGGKAQLVAAMYREGFRRLGDALAARDTTTGDDLLALRETGRAYRRAALASPALYALMFGPLMPGFAPSAEDEAAAGSTYLPLVEGVQDGVDAGVLRGDPSRIARHLWAVAHGAVSLELAGLLEADTDPDQHYDEALLFAITPFLASKST